MNDNFSNSGSGSNSDLADKIESGEYDNKKNRGEVYEAPNGMKINIKDQEGADTMAGWLREADDRAALHENALRINELANDGVSPRAVSPFVSPELTDALKRQDVLAETAKADARHQEVLDGNTKANEGFTGGMAQAGTDALKRQDVLAEAAKADARHQEVLDRNTKANEGFTGGMAQAGTDALKRQDVLAEAAKADARHQEVLDGNTKANEGFTDGMTQTGRNALNAQDTIAELAKENAKLKEPQVTTPSTPERDLHQEALDRNAKANEGFTGGMAQAGTDALKRQDVLAEAAKADARHQEVLDGNTKANEGFTDGMTQTGRNALNAQDTIAELAKENSTLKEEKELTPEQKELKEIKILIKEQSVQIQQLILIMQQNITNINGVSAATEPIVQPVEVTPTPVTELTPEQKEIIDIKAAVNQQSEQINQLLIMMQQNNINVNNGNGAPIPTGAANVGGEGSILPPTEATMTTATTENTPVAQETTPTPEARRKLKVAYIAGAVIGGSTGILGGVPAAGIGALVCIAGGLLNTGVNKLSGLGIERWNRRLATVTDPAERTKLEKRVARLEKIKKFTETTASDFLRGARHGLLASSIFSGIFLAGHGLAWNTPEVISPTSNPAAGGNHGGSVGTGGTETGAGSSPETYQGNDFIDKNGQIHANGSPWDSKYVAGPEGNLPGGAENASNYVEGPWGRTPSVVDNFLKQNNITDTSFLDGYDRDRILDETWLQIKNGNANPDMAGILKHINTEGTNKLLSAIGQQ